MIIFIPMCQPHGLVIHKYLRSFLDSKKNAEINGLKGMVKDLEAKLLSEIGKFSSLSDQRESTELEKETLKLEIESIQKKLADTQAELSTESMLVEKLKSKTTDPEVWDAMKASLSDKDTLISEMQENESFLTVKMAELNKEIKSYSKQLEVEKGINNNHKIEIKNLNQSLAAAKEHVSKLVTLNDELKQLNLSKRFGNVHGSNNTTRAEHEQADRKNRNQSLGEAIQNNQICIREVNQPGSCHPRSDKGCSFSHDIPNDLDNASRNSLMLLWSEKHNKCAFEFTKKGSCREKENCTQCVLHKKQISARTAAAVKPKYCFSEMKQKGSCQWKDGCRFNHEIPERLREDHEAQTEFVQEKEEKAGKCVNEYRKEGSCHKGRECCRFSHDISPADRANTEMQMQMKLKYENIVNPKKKNSLTQVNNGTLTMDAAKQLFNQFLIQVGINMPEP